MAADTAVLHFMYIEYMYNNNNNIFILYSVPLINKFSATLYNKNMVLTFKS